VRSGFRPFKWGQKPAPEPTVWEEGKASPLEAAAPKPSFAPEPIPAPPPLGRPHIRDRLFLIEAQLARAVADELQERGLTYNRFSEHLRTTPRHARQIVEDGKVKLPMLARLCQVFNWTIDMKDAQGRLILTYPHLLDARDRPAPPRGS
jgi:hypothetical protein